MTQRSVYPKLAHRSHRNLIRAGGAGAGRGPRGASESWLSTAGRWGLKVERRGDAIEVHLGGSGGVYVPPDSSVKVYTGKDMELHSIGGSATIYAAAAPCCAASIRWPTPRRRGRWMSGASILWATSHAQRGATCAAVSASCATRG